MPFKLQEVYSIEYNTCKIKVNLERNKHVSEKTMVVTGLSGDLGLHAEETLLEKGYNV